ncbi:MAG: ABC transporter permease [Aquabacterium sp.]|nr:MAG: ABC transporter permease [Aquabacterium sp.]
MNAIRSGLSRTIVGLPLLLALLLAATSEDFRQARNLTNFAGQIAALLIASLGQLFTTLVGGIDLSVGALMSLTSCIVATQGDPVAGIALALAAGMLVGLVNGWGVAVAGVHPLIMTLGTATCVQGLCHFVLPIPGGQVPAALAAAAGTTEAGLPLSLPWCVAAIAAVGVLLGRTRLGLHLHAVGSQARSAYLNGVPARAVVMFAYIACSVMAVVAGIYLTARVSAGDPALGSAFALESVAAVALGGVQLTGGVGSVAGVTAGALTLGLLTNGLNLFGVSPFMRGVLTGCLLLAAVSLQRRRIVGM